MARRNRRGRPIDGILVLDKSAGQSSNAVLQEAKRLYFAAKAGHTGSLDPLATGVLPLCFGEATKFSQFLLEADKSYVSTFVLGAVSDSGDADGTIEIQADVSSLTQALVEQTLQGFLGEQKQLPPMYSALKVAGKRLYELARQGIEVDRKERDVRIDKAELLAFRSGALTEIDVLLTVSKGTYIRSIASDLGDKLACGAYVKTLRRTAVGMFDETQSVSLDTLRALKEGEQFDKMDALLLPVDAALEHLETVVLDESSSFYLQRGQAVQVAKAPTSGLVKVKMDTGLFLGVGQIDSDGCVAPKRLVVN